jgi:hypothetical protein
MEWYEWVFAFCGASMAVGTVLMAVVAYGEIRDRRLHRSEPGPRHYNR